MRCKINARPCFAAINQRGGALEAREGNIWSGLRQALLSRRRHDGIDSRATCGYASSFCPQCLGGIFDKSWILPHERLA
jgi:hypothetical protein